MAERFHSRRLPGLRHLVFCCLTNKTGEKKQTNMMIRRHPGILLLFLLACHLSVTAQQHGKADEPKLDTTVADTIVVGGEEPGLQTHVDTSFPASPELGNATPPPAQLPVPPRLPATPLSRTKTDPKYTHP